MPSQANLVLFTPHGRRKDIPLTPGVTTVGRRPDCEVRIPLASVSRRHCEFHIGDASVQVKDLGSANGVLVNRQPIQEIQELAAGDMIHIGTLSFVLQIDGKPTEVYPPGDPDETAFPPGLSGSVPGLADMGDSLSDLDPTAE